MSPLLALVLLVLLTLLAQLLVLVLALVLIQLMASQMRSHATFRRQRSALTSVGPGSAQGPRMRWTAS